jgi:hypothetical protein
MRPEIDREEQDQQQAPPEDRHGEAGQRRAHQRVIDEGAAPGRRDHAGRDAEDRREQHGADGQFQRRREQRREFGQDRRLRRDRGAEIAVRDLPEIVEKLFPHRLVETELMAEMGQTLGRDAALAGTGLDRVARHEPDRDEGEEGDGQEGRNDQQHAPDDETEHGDTAWKARREAPSRPSSPRKRGSALALAGRRILGLA